MAAIAHIPARFSKALVFGAFIKGLFRKEQVPHWTEYLRDSHRV